MFLLYISSLKTFLCQRKFRFFCVSHREITTAKTHDARRHLDPDGVAFHVRWRKAEKLKAVGNRARHLVIELLVSSAFL
jgi:hypothetical protein